MRTKTQKIRVGLFVAITGVLVTVILITFAGMRFWQGYDRYKILFDGSVIGLDQGALVYLNGIKVGSVETLEVAEKDLRKVLITIAVNGGTPIRTDTRATLQYAGITGLKIVDLRGGTSSSPPLPPGSTIAPGDTLLDRLASQAEELAEQSTELMERANRIAQKLEGIDEVVANLTETSRSLELLVRESRRGLHQSLAAVRHTARSASTLMDGHLSQLVANADTLVSDVKAVVQRNEADVRMALFDLRQASRNFNELSREVRQRPSRLLFSQPATERKLP